MNNFLESGVEFGEKLKIEIKDLDKLIEALNKFERLLASIMGDFTLIELGIGFVITCFAAGIAFTLGRRIAEFTTWIPVGLISLFRRSEK